MYFFSVDYFKYIDILLPLSIAVFIGTNFGKIILGFIPEKIFIEISGGVTLKTILKYNIDGVNGISIGALTHQSRSVDIGLDIY